MITRDQARGLHAYTCVGRVVDWEPRERSGYRTLARGLGALIMGNGLIGALAFVKRFHRKDTAAAFLCDLAQADIPGLRADDEKQVDLVALCQLSMAEYMLATREALQVALWLNRAATALLPTESDGDDADGDRPAGDA